MSSVSTVTVGNVSRSELTETIFLNGALHSENSILTSLKQPDKF